MNHMKNVTSDRVRPDHLLVRAGRKMRTAARKPGFTWRWLQDRFMTWVVGMPVALFARLVRPVVHLRFNVMDDTRIGVFAGCSSVYLTQKSIGRHKGFVDLMGTISQCDPIHESVPVNKPVYRLLNEKLHFRPWAGWASKANDMLPGREAHTVPLYSMDEDGSCIVQPPAVEVPADIMEVGDRWLADRGIDKDTPVLLFANRDQAYLEQFNPEKAWNYHDYRNSDIHAMLPMVNRFVEKGYGAVRFGAAAEQAIGDVGPKIIDLPFEERREELDIYLGWRCRFFISVSSGIGDLPRMFRRPVSFVNAAPFLTMASMRMKNLPSEIWIPKLYWSKKEKRLLTFSEIVACPAADSYFSEEFHRAGIELVENTPDEISELALETEEILDGRQDLDKESRDLYDRFWSIYLQGKPWAGESRIALSFLRRHIDLLK